MRVTKYEHAAQIVEDEGRRLIIDPGSFTQSLGDVDNVDAIVITHEHADHWTPEHLTSILDANPSAMILGPAGVATALGKEGFTVQTVTDGDTVEVGAFTLTFAGTKHAVIHSSIPVPDNTGVLVNGRLFYPGDSFFVPSFPVEVLAVPAGAPWLKIGEAMDYVTAVKPQRTYPVHEQTLSAPGFAMHADRIGAMTTAAGGTPSVLQPGESLEV